MTPQTVITGQGHGSGSAGPVLLAATRAFLTEGIDPPVEITEVPSNPGLFVVRAAAIRKWTEEGRVVLMEEADGVVKAAMIRQWADERTANDTNADADATAAEEQEQGREQGGQAEDSEEAQEERGESDGGWMEVPRRRRARARDAAPAAPSR